MKLTTTVATACLSLSLLAQSPPHDLRLLSYPMPASLSNKLNGDLAALIAGKNVSQWGWYEGSTTSWIYPLDVSGIALSGDASSVSGGPLGAATSGDMMLVTSKHGIAAKHMFQPGDGNDNPGRKIVFAGVDGTLVTNVIESTSDWLDDIIVVTLVSNVPSSVHPFKLFPTNVHLCFPGVTIWNNSKKVMNALNGVNGIWFRNNTGKMNVAGTTNGTGSGQIGFDIRPVTTFTDNSSATGGDSSGPMMYVFGTNAVLACAMTGPTPSGSFLSDPEHTAFIQARIGTNTLSFIDLTGYETYRPTVIP